MDHHNASQDGRCPADILVLIFEVLCCTTPASLLTVRLASKEYKILVDPIVYRHLKLNEALLKCFDCYDEPNVPREILNARRGVESAIGTFTRQITIDKPLKWSLVINMLLSLDRFDHLHWYFWETERVFSRPSQVPSSILSCLAEHWPSAKLSVNNLSYIPEAMKELRSLPAINLASLQLQLKGALRRLDGSLKTFLLQCDQLKVLHLYPVVSGARFLDEEIEKSDILPPVKELFLQGYFWLHSPTVATGFWNWSKLTSLRLEKVFIINFLESVLPENLLQLRSLITDGHCESPVDHAKVSLHVISPRLGSFSQNHKSCTKSHDFLFTRKFFFYKR